MHIAWVNYPDIGVERIDAVRKKCDPRRELSVHAEGRVTMFHGGTSDARSPHMTAFAHLKDAVVADGYVSEQRDSDFLELQDNPSFAWREGLTMAAWGRRPSVAP